MFTTLQNLHVENVMLTMWIFAGLWCLGTIMVLHRALAMNESVLKYICALYIRYTQADHSTVTLTHR